MQKVLSLESSKKLVEAGIVLDSEMCRICGEDYDKLEGTDDPCICEECKQGGKND